MPISDRALEAIQARTTKEVFLPLVTIAHPDMTETIYVVSNEENITSRGQEFIGYPFNIDLPPDDPDLEAGTQIVIDNVDRDILVELRKIRGKPKVTFALVLAATPDYYERGPMTFSHENTDYDAATITGTIIFDTVLEEQSPGYAITPQYFPALF